MSAAARAAATATSSAAAHLLLSPRLLAQQGREILCAADGLVAPGVAPEKVHRPVQPVGEEGRRPKPLQPLGCLDFTQHAMLAVPAVHAHVDAASGGDMHGDWKALGHAAAARGKATLRSVWLHNLVCEIVSGDQSA